MATRDVFPDAEMTVVRLLEFKQAQPVLFDRDSETGLRGAADLIDALDWAMSALEQAFNLLPRETRAAVLPRVRGYRERVDA